MEQFGRRRIKGAIQYIHHSELDEVLCLELWSVAGLDAITESVPEPLRPTFKRTFHRYAVPSCAETLRHLPPPALRELLPLRAAWLRQLALAHAARVLPGTLMGDIGIFVNGADDGERLDALHRLARRVRWKTAARLAVPAVAGRLA